MRRYKGLFVTFEGIDGTGKTTCVRKVAAMAAAAGEDVVLARCPGGVVDGRQVGSDIGDGLRRLLFFEPSTKGMAPGVADLLYMADHLQCTHKIIVPALDACKVVLCDRYADSQYAYAMHPSKGTPAWAFEMYDRLATLEPDLTILLTCDPEEAWARSKARVGDDAVKQDGKAWAAPMAQALIQGAYLGRLRHLERTRVVDVGGMDADQVAAVAYKFVLEARDEA